MATKPGNRVTFHAEGYGTVQLVKRSIAKRLFDGDFYNNLTRCFEYRRFWYWRGQLVNDWEGTGPNEGEAWGTFNKGQIVWLDAGLFQEVAD